MPRTTSTLSPYARPARAHFLSGGNGNGNSTPPAVSSPDRLGRIEVLLESLEKTLAVQFQRIAEIQVQLDRAIADRPLGPRR